MSLGGVGHVELSEGFFGLKMGIGLKTERERDGNIADVKWFG